MVKRLIVLGILAFLVAGLFVVGISDGSPSIADTTIADNQVPSSVNEPDGSDSASATITITMYALPEEEWR